MSTVSLTAAARGRPEHVMFDGDDFPGWKLTMEMTLKKMGLWEITTTKEDDYVEKLKTALAFQHPKATAESVAAMAKAEYQGQDQKAHAEITLSIAPKRRAMVSRAKSASEAWTKVLKLFQQQSASHRAYLKKRLNSLKLQPDGDVWLHLNEVQSIADQLESAGAAPNEEDIIGALIQSLPAEWDNFVSALKWQQNLDLDTIKRRIFDEWTWRKQKEDASASAMLSHQRRPDAGRERLSGRQGAQATQQGGYRRDRSGGARLPVRYRNCYVCGSKEHLCRDCPKRFREKSEEDGLIVSESDQTSSSLYLDSACTQHMVKDPQLLSNKRQLGRTVRINVASNMGHESARVNGDLTVGQGRVTLKGALWVPGFRKNLISVYRLAKQTKGTVTFSEHGFVARDSAGKILLQGPAEEGLYRLEDRLEEAIVADARHHAKDDWRLWHARIGHFGNRTMRWLHNKGLFSLAQEEPREVCKSCVQGKATRKTVQREKPQKHVATQKLERIHCDVAGPFPLSRSGYSYYIVFVDEKTRFVVGYPMKSKDEAAEKLKSAVIEFAKLAPGHRVLKYRSDNAKELSSSRSIKALCDEQKIIVEPSAPYSPFQNGIAERTIRTVTETMRCLLHQGNLSVGFWEDALMAAIFVKNRCPTRVTQQIPMEELTGTVPNLKGLRAFGCTAHALIQPRGPKLQSKTVQCKLIGYQSEGTYKLWDPVGRKVVISRDVTFDEQEAVARSWGGMEEPQQNDLAKDDRWRPAVDDSKQVRYTNGIDDSDDEGDGVVQAPLEQLEVQDDGNDIVDGAQEQLLQQVDNEPELDGGQDEDASVDDGEEDEEEPAVQPRRTNRRWRPSDRILKHLAQVSEEVPPVEEAIRQPQWSAAMQDEHKSLLDNKTWELVDLPKGRKAIDTKWVLKKKLNASGQVERYKARLVAKGFKQIPGRDYHETFAPVAKMASFKVLLALSGTFKLKLEHLDVKTAFLQGDLEETIYMKQPRYFEKAGEEHKVCQLKKSLYGLKQSPRCWNKKLHQTLQSCGLQRTNADHCMYVLRRGGDVAILVIWVDDMVLGCNSETLSKEIKEKLAKDLQITDLGPLSYFLGMHVQQHNEGLTLSQHKYAKEILEAFRMSDCKPVATPMDVGCHLLKRKEDEPKCEQDVYRKAVGSLQYLCNTRPDICQAVGVVSRFCGDSSEDHWGAVKRILRYVKGTIDFGIQFKHGNNLRLLGYADADWAGDLQDRKSTSGYVFFLNGAPVSYCSKKQLSVALSTAEAEYMAASLAAQETMWLRCLLQEMGVEQEGATTLLQDNQGAIAIAKNPELHSRTKHIDIRYHFIRECVESKVIKEEYCATQDMVADILTKPLGGQVFSRLRSKLCVG